MTRDSKSRQRATPPKTKDWRSNAWVITKTRTESCSKCIQKRKERGLLSLTSQKKKPPCWQVCLHLQFLCLPAHGVDASPVWCLSSHKYPLEWEATLGGTEHSGAALPLLPTALGSAGAGTDGHPQAEPQSFPSSATGWAAAPDLPGSLSAAAWTALLWASRWCERLGGKSKELWISAEMGVVLLYPSTKGED